MFFSFPVVPTNLWWCREECVMAREGVVVVVVAMRMCGEKAVSGVRLSACISRCVTRVYT